MTKGYISAVDATIGFYALSAAGITRSPDARDRCPYCDTDIQRRNTLRHRLSGGHIRRMRAALEAGRSR